MRKTMSTVLTVALLTALGVVQAHAGNPSSSVDCAFLGDVKVHLNNGSSVEGILGANADDGRVTIGKRSTAADGSTIIGAAVRLGNSSVVDNVASDSPLRRGRNVTINGSVTGAILPIEDPFCPVPQFTCGGPSVVVLRGDAESITPGSYSQIVVEGGGSLTLAAGTYQICSLSAGRKATITVESGAQSTLNIVDELTLENGASLATSLGTVPPQINVLGKRVRLAPNALLQGFVSAPNATARIGNGASFVGSLCARRISTGRGVSLSCSDVLPTTTSTVPVTTSSTTTTSSTSTTVTSSTIIGTTSSTSTSSTTSTSTTTTTGSPFLDCPCWDDFTQEQLAAALNSATPAFPTCSVSATEVVLSDADGNPELSAANDGEPSCSLVTGNIDRNLVLDSAAAAVCLTEATDIEPLITWCGAGSTTSTAQESTTSTSVPETTTSTAAPETTTTTSVSTSSTSSTSSSTSTSTSTTIAPPLLDCPCWVDFTQEQLAEALNSAMPAFPTCSTSASEVVISGDDSFPEVAAINNVEVRACRLAVGTIERELALDSAAAAVCIGEATELEPEVAWCNEGTTTSTAQASTTSTSVPETTTSTAAPETTTTTSSSTTSSSIETTTTTFMSTSTSSVSSTSSTSTTVSTSSTTSTSSSTSSTSTSTSTSSSSSSTSTSSSTSSTSTSSSTSSTSTSSSTSSTSTSTSSTTTTTVAGPPTILDFTTTIGAGICGRTYSNTSGTAGAQLTTLSCGGLKLGAGQSFVGENITPDGSTNRMGLVCSGNSCFITSQSQVTPDYDCSVTGCRFGAPLPLSAGGISSCILNTFTQNVGGTLNLSTGVASMNIVLNSRTYVTGNNAFPCPVCLNAPGGTPLNGTPSNPLTGVCSRGPNAGQACTTRNSRGLTNDCQPDGTIAGDIPVNLAPVTTGSRTQNEQDRLFCPGQENFGCFEGGTNCRRIVVDGQAAGTLALNTPTPVRLASIFCVEATNNPTVNVSTDLPGPGATSLVGTFTTRN